MVVVEDNDPKPPVYGNVKVRTTEFLRSRIKETGAVDVSPLALRHMNVPAELTAEAVSPTRPNRLAKRGLHSVAYIKTADENYLIRFDIEAEPKF